jgi:hypothetical protein
MMQTQRVLSPTVSSIEKQQQQQDHHHHQHRGSDTSMDEKKESSITETTESSTESNPDAYGIAVPASLLLPHQNLYNPYAIAAAAQYHNMMLVQQHQQHQQHQHNTNRGGLLVNGVTLHHPQAHHQTGHPPQQVYVDTATMQHVPVGNTNLGHLETQFQALGFNTTSHNNMGEDNNDNNNNNVVEDTGERDQDGNNNENDNPHDDNDGNGEDEHYGQVEEGQEDEEEPVKLFVGQVRTEDKAWKEWCIAISSRI